MKNNVRGGRDANMDLLRLSAIFMIVVFHCSIKSGFDFPAGFSANWLIVKCFWMLGELGVNLFMLASGFYQVRGRFRWKKAARLLVQAQFYTWGAVWLGLRLGFYELPGWRSVLYACFPVTLLDRYWFLTAYLIVYLLSPFLNLLIGAMDRAAHRRLLAVVLTLFCLIPTVLGVLIDTTESLLYYNRMIWLAVMYILGAYLRLYESGENRRKYAAMTLGSIAVIVASILVIGRFAPFFAALGTTEPAYFWRPNTVPMVCLSLGVFGLFRGARVPDHPALGVLASTTLGIYLFHDGILAPWLWRTVFRCAAYQDSIYLIPRILASALAVTAAGAAIDLARQALERRILDLLPDRAAPGKPSGERGKDGP